MARSPMARIRRCPRASSTRTPGAHRIEAKRPHLLLPGQGLSAPAVAGAPAGGSTRPDIGFFTDSPSRLPSGSSVRLCVRGGRSPPRQPSTADAGTTSSPSWRGTQPRVCGTGTPPVVTIPGRTTSHPFGPRLRRVKAPGATVDRTIPRAHQLQIDLILAGRTGCRYSPETISRDTVPFPTPHGPTSPLSLGKRVVDSDIFNLFSFRVSSGETAGPRIPHPRLRPSPVPPFWTPAPPKIVIIRYMSSPTRTPPRFFFACACVQLWLIFASTLLFTPPAAPRIRPRNATLAHTRISLLKPPSQPFDNCRYPVFEEAPILLPQPLPAGGAPLSRGDQVRQAARSRKIQRAYRGHWGRFLSWVLEQELDLPEAVC